MVKDPNIENRNVDVLFKVGYGNGGGHSIVVSIGFGHSIWWRAGS
jgi:hypothetical protein